ncbi:GtrA family protein, partial [Mycobacterium kansasii]
LIIVDFVLNYIVGNLLQMAFRFWALRRYAFPEDMRDAPDQESIPDDETRANAER